MSTEERTRAIGELRPEFVRASVRSMHGRMRRALGLVLLVPLALACTGKSSGQQQSGSGVWVPIQPADSTMPDAGRTAAGEPAMGEKRLHQLNVAQHKSMVSDTDKLLRMVKDLNAEIDRTNPSSLTPEELRKVAEIEKLARSVKDKMRTSVRGTSAIIDTMPSISDPTFGH